MYRRTFIVLALGIVLVAAALLLPTVTSASGSSLSARTHTVAFKYVAKYPNRLVNADVAFRQLQEFFDKVEWKKGRQYSFIRDVMHNTVDPKAGYVDTPLGFGFGSCGASSLLNKMVKTATFIDSDGKEKPVFFSVMVWTWRGDPTYEKYGATIYVDPTGEHQKDYIWRLNPEYDGPRPKLVSHFDINAEGVDMVMEYGDEAPAATPTAKATQVPTAVPTAIPTKKANNANANAKTPTAQVTKVADASAANANENDNNNSAKVENASIVKPTAKESAVTLKQQYTLLVKGNRFSVSVIPIGGASSLLEEVGMNQDMQTYVASAFKGPVAIYFFEHVDPKIWKSVPIKFWNVKEEKDVEPAYRADWNQYKDILGDLWTTVVWSENDSTGDVMAYVYKNTAASKLGNNPITAFNNWVHQAAGATISSGLRSWYDGATNCADCVDERYGKQAFIYMGKVLIPNNSFSARDLALVYVRLATKGRELGYYNIATELMGLWRGPSAPSMLQWHLGKKLGITTASKDGFVGPDDRDSDGYYISTDAGLLTLPDGKQYAVAFMAFDSGNLLDDAISMLGKILVPQSTKKS